MISRTVKLQFVAFLVVAFLGIAYVGFNYIGLPLVTRTFTVTANLPDSGGLFTNGQVTYRGVPIGTVGPLHLTKAGIAVDLRLRKSWDHKIPANLKVQVQNGSAVGEQYLDLQPTTDSGPYLRGGSIIDAAQANLPVSDAALLKSLDDLVNSVNRQDLITVIDELGTGFNGAGPELQKIIEQGNTVVQAATDALPQTEQLINDGQTVLRTQQAAAQDLRTFARDLNALSATVAAPQTDAAIRTTFDNGVAAAQTVQGLLTDVRTDLPHLLTNLAVIGQIGSERSATISEIFSLYPLAVANSFSGVRTIDDQRGFDIHRGLASLGLVNAPSNQTGSSTFGPCTAGYQPRSTAKLTTTTPAVGTYCAEPPNDGRNVEVRGTQQAPRPPGDTTNVPGGGMVDSATVGGSSFGGATIFNPTTNQVLGHDGQTYVRVRGAASGPSWQWLLIGPAIS